MQAPRIILLYGHDELLLMTRARILEGAGFRVNTTCEVKEIPRLIRQFRADLLVLCHSLTRTESVVAGMVAKNHRAEVRTLLMVANGCIGERDYGMSEIADEIFNLSLDPEKLITKVRSMLGRRPQSRLRFSCRQESIRLAATN